jgi:carbonic anhydrase
MASAVAKEMAKQMAKENEGRAGRVIAMSIGVAALAAGVAVWKVPSLRAKVDEAIARVQGKPSPAGALPEAEAVARAEAEAKKPQDATPGQTGTDGVSAGAAAGADKAGGANKNAGTVDDSAKAAGHGWGYRGESGPDHWAALSPEASACQLGEKQSPIDLLIGAKAGRGREISFSYQAMPLTLVNNGHTLQANAAGKGDAASAIRMDGTSYRFLQFHFHGPSEHVFNGAQYPLEAHFVHKSSGGQLAVLGVVFKEGPANATLEQLWKTLPKEGTSVDLKGGVDVLSLIPAEGEAFAYDGSLTTPPCSEGVAWTVYASAQEVSRDQIFRFRDLFPQNARPAQALNARTVTRFRAVRPRLAAADDAQ